MADRLRHAEKLATDFTDLFFATENTEVAENSIIFNRGRSYLVSHISWEESCGTIFYFAGFGEKRDLRFSILSWVKSLVVSRQYFVGVDFGFGRPFLCNGHFQSHSGNFLIQSFPSKSGGGALTSYTRCHLRPHKHLSDIFLTE